MSKLLLSVIYHYLEFRVLFCEIATHLSGAHNDRQLEIFPANLSEKGKGSYFLVAFSFIIAKRRSVKCAYYIKCWLFSSFAL